MPACQQYVDGGALSLSALTVSLEDQIHNSGFSPVHAHDVLAIFRSSNTQNFLSVAGFPAL